MRVVIPAKAGIQERDVGVDSRFRGNDKLSHVTLFEQFTVASDTKSVSLSWLLRGIAAFHGYWEAVKPPPCASAVLQYRLRYVLRKC